MLSIGLSSKRSFPRLLIQSEGHMKVLSKFMLIVFLASTSMVVSAQDGMEHSRNAIKQFRENQQRIHGDKTVEQQVSADARSGQDD